MTRLLILLIAFAGLAFLTPEYRLLTRIPAQASFITSDDLGNCYAVDHNNIEKYSTNGTLLKTYSNKSFGDITLVDVTDPMKPLLFYREFSKIVFLDNTLSMNGSPISFEERGFQDVQLVAHSHNNGLWLFTGQNSELVRLDDQFAITNRTGDLRQVLGMNIAPNYMIEYNNKIYLNSPSEGILIFDMYGTYFKTIPVKNLLSFQVQEDELLYHLDGKLHSYNLRNLQEQQLPLPDSTALSLRVEKERMFVRKEKCIEVYDVK